MSKFNNIKVPFSTTVVKNKQRHICCTKQLKSTGNEIANLPFYSVSEGEAEIKQFKSLEECSSWFSGFEESGDTNTLLLSGIPTSEPLEDEVYQVRSKNKAVEASISLSAADFTYTQMPTLGLIDYDPPKSSENAKFHDEIRSKGVLVVLHERMPELGLNELSHIYRDSTSAGIIVTDEEGNGRPYKSMEGIHIFFLISSGLKLQELLEYMFQQCILSGLFWVEPDKLGRGMIKTPIDTAPSKSFTPRITAPAKLINSQGAKWKLSRSNLRKVEYVDKQNAMLDASSILTHTEEKISECEEIIKTAVAKYNSQPAVAAKIEADKATLKKEYLGTKKTITRDIDRAIDSMVDRSLIFGDFELLFDGEKESVTAKSLAGLGGEQYDGATLHDPLDPSPKNKGKSIFYWNEAKNPYIHSFKHGGYGLRVYAEEPLSSNEWMNRHHAQVFKGEGLLYAIDKKDFGSVGPLDERITFVTEAALKKLYEGRFAYDSKGKVVTNDK